MSQADQLNAIAADLRNQAAALEAIAGGGSAPPAPPAGGQGMVSGTIIKGHQPPAQFDAKGGVFAFVAVAQVQIDTGFTPGAGPRPSNTGKIWISETPDGPPLIGPNDFFDNDSYGTIGATALTPGVTYYVTVVRDQGGGWFIQYV